MLRVLLERKLIRILGRKELAGRPLIYATTKRFLEVFDLKSLRDLPTPKEIEELGASASEGDTLNLLDTAATSETLLETSGGVEAAGERLQQTETSQMGSPEGELAQDTLRQTDVESGSDSPENQVEKSS